ncbi:MAG: AraC family transcriptional regulator [Gammaproteobacteria bacterium]|nr:AraC family transcriptional regulator [Gammaproteobacteria bacterium]
MAGLVNAVYVRALLDHLRERGIDPSNLYTAQAIAEIEGRDGRSQIPLTQWLAMIDAATTATNDPDLPLKVGIGMQMKHIGMLGYVVMSCATMGDAIAQLQRYSRLVGDISYTRLVPRGRQVELVWEWAHDSQVPPAVPQLQLAARASLARRLTDRPDWNAAAHFQFKRPGNAALYDRFFGQSTRFDQPRTKLVFMADELKLPVVTADAEMRKLVTVEVISTPCSSRWPERTGRSARTEKSSRPGAWRLAAYHWPRPPNRSTPLHEARSAGWINISAHIVRSSMRFATHKPCAI